MIISSLAYQKSIILLSWKTKKSKFSRQGTQNALKRPEMLFFEISLSKNGLELLLF